MTGKPWIVYVRVSTDEQVSQGSSLDAQEAACRALLKAHNHEPVEVVKDPGASAKNLNRPGVRAVLARIEAGEIAGVAVYAIDRLSRRNRDLWDIVDLIEKRHVELISVRERVDTSGPMGRFVLGLIGGIAQLERETISERVTMGKRHRQAQGGFVGGRVPPGCVVIGEKGRRVLIADPALSPEVRQVWSMVSAGATLGQVCAYLNGLGIRPSSKTKAWNRQNLGHFMRCERVLGLLVDRETRDTALAVLGSRFSPQRAKVGGQRTVAAVRSERVWRLAPFARCADCGQTLVGLHARGKGGKWFAYLRCSGKAKGACAARDMPAATWEDAVITCCQKAVVAGGPLMRRLTEQRLRSAASAEAAAGRRGDLVMAQDKLQRRIDRLVDLVAEGDAAGRAVAPKLAELQGEKERGEIDIAECDGSLSAAQMTHADAEVMIEELRRGVADLPNRTPAEQAVALRLLLIDVRLGAERPIEIVLRVPGAASGFVHKSRLVQQVRLDTNPGRLTFPVTVDRRAGKIVLGVGTPLG